MKYIVAIDQSTSASKVFLVDDQGAIQRQFAAKHSQYYPHPGYVEHDAEEIWQNVLTGMITVTEGLDRNDIAAVAIANQRETIVLWDRQTGAPVMRAIVWQDIRGADFCAERKKFSAMVADKTGLQLSPYYSATKIGFTLAEDGELARRAADGHLCAGTIDSYLIFRMTGGAVSATDVSNAGRTSLMNLKTLDWDHELCALFGVPVQCLPKITHSDGDFGIAPIGAPITGVMGDSHAALFGQGCLRAGMAKATFGTGSSVMLNVGNRAVFSQNGLSACVGFGFAGETNYVLEGNVTSSGDTLCWLRDEMGLISDVFEAEATALAVQDTQDVYLVPAFSGLGAPYFSGSARAAMIGMNRGTTREHIVRAALESIAYQDADIVEAMERDTGRKLTELRVDGAPSKNAFLMGFLSDMIDCRVLCARRSELSALGAAYMAGIKTGLYDGFDGIPAARERGEEYLPSMTGKHREMLRAGWKQAVARCL